MNFLHSIECEEENRPEIEHENSMENPSENTIDELRKLRKTRDYFINFRRSYETLELCTKKGNDNFIEIQQRLDTTLYNAITDKNHSTIQ